MFAFSTLHKSWLPSLIFSPYGRDKREGAGCGSPFSAACRAETGYEVPSFGPLRSKAGNNCVGVRRVTK
jgi:hypothetical protein